MRGRRSVRDGGQTPDPCQFIWQVNQTFGLERDETTLDPRQFIWQVNQTSGLRASRTKTGPRNLPNLHPRSTSK